MYVKQFNEQGKLLNPITKDNPFINKPSKVKKVKQRLKQKLVVTKLGTNFYKYFVTLQKIGNKTIEHYTVLN